MAPARKRSKKSGGASYGSGTSSNRISPTSQTEEFSAELSGSTLTVDDRGLGQVYSVAEIIGERTVTINQFCVKWNGYSVEEATWENEDHLESCRDLIIEFKSRRAASNHSRESEQVQSSEFQADHFLPSSSMKEASSNLKEIDECTRSGKSDESHEPLFSTEEAIANPAGSKSRTRNLRSNKSEMSNSASSSSVENRTVNPQKFKNELPHEALSEESSPSYMNLEGDTNSSIHSDETEGMAGSTENTEVLEFMNNGRWSVCPPRLSHSGIQSAWQKLKRLAESIGLKAVLDNGELKLEKTNEVKRTKQNINILDKACEMKIIGGTDEGGWKFLLEVKNPKTRERIQQFVPAAQARAYVPQLVIDYYEKHVVIKKNL